MQCAKSSRQAARQMRKKKKTRWPARQAGSGGKKNVACNCGSENRARTGSSAHVRKRAPGVCVVGDGVPANCCAAGSCKIRQFIQRKQSSVCGADLLLRRRGAVYGFWC